MKTASIDVIERTFQKIADMVTPTMGARGRLAVLDDEMGRPILTDDGVTVAKQAFGFEGIERMIALGMVEAANNTERIAYDGTTLTILLTNELYKQGLRWVKRGMHPQIAADKILSLTSEVLDILDKRYCIPIKPEARLMLVERVAAITTKIPSIGALVAQAYELAGDAMHVHIEHERDGDTRVEQSKGMVLDNGYFSQTLRELCNQGNKAVYEKPLIALLSEGTLTPNGLIGFFRSIPASEINRAVIYVVHKGFNPEVLQRIIETMVENNRKFMLVFINEGNPEEIFLDLAAYTGSKIQDSAMGTSDYRYEHCGTVDQITIEQDKTLLKNTSLDAEKIQSRVQYYEQELHDTRYRGNRIRISTMSQRIANLTKGITTIKVAVPTITEFLTLRLKLDDAIGAVKCALKEGIVYGAGIPLLNIGHKYVKELKGPLSIPARLIVKNAGLRWSNSFQKRCLRQHGLGMNVITGQEVDLLHSGIIDSVTSVRTAISNSASIASNYLRAFIVIVK